MLSNKDYRYVLLSFRNLLWELKSFVQVLYRYWRYILTFFFFFFFRYTCINSVPVNTTYTGIICDSSSSTVNLPQNCVVLYFFAPNYVLMSQQNNGTYGYRYSCVDLSEKLQPNERLVIQYTDSNCDDKPLYYIRVTDGACVSAFSTSFKVGGFSFSFSLQKKKKYTLHFAT